MEKKLFSTTETQQETLSSPKNSTGIHFSYMHLFVMFLCLHIKHGFLKRYFLNANVFLIIYCSLVFLIFFFKIKNHYSTKVEYKESKPKKCIAKKPQVVLLHARTLNIKRPFLSKTSVAKLLTKSASRKRGFKCN